MKLIATALALVLGLSVASSAQAGVVFSDNFNSENGGVGVLNYTGFANWDVSDGTVDLIGNGYFQLGIPTSYGLFVDMDGSTGNAGEMTTSTSLSLDAGTYLLSFDLAGNRRNGSTETVSVDVEVGLFSETFSLAQNAPFQTFTRSFTLATAQTVDLVFAGSGGDNIGMLLDNVQVATVPIPPAAWLGLASLSVLGLARLRRRRKA